MITNVKHQGDGGYAATIDGVKWQNITPGTYHYSLVQEWIAEGNIPNPEDSLILIEKLKTELTNYLNNEAKLAGFFSLENAGKYTGYVNPFQSKAETLLTWVANFWVTAQSIEADVLSSVRPMPDYTSLLSEILAANPKPAL